MATSLLAEQLEKQIQELEAELFDLNLVIDELYYKLSNETNTEKKQDLETKINTANLKYESLNFLRNVTQAALNKEVEEELGYDNYFEVTESAADY
jgi:predicted  nucleic acid-binding Zn-ribbon protein